MTRNLSDTDGAVTLFRFAPVAACVRASCRFSASGSTGVARTRRGPTWVIRGLTWPGRAGRGGLRRQELPPQAALLAPVQRRGDRLQVGQEDGVAAALGPRQEEQGLLDVGGQAQQ